jgi:hypothetical protein
VKKLPLKISDEHYELLNFDQKMTYLDRRIAHFDRLIKLIQLLQVITIGVWAGVIIYILIIQLIQ